MEAVVDRAFQTMRGSSPGRFARDSTTRVAVVSDAIEAIRQVSEPAATVTVPARRSGRAAWNTTPEGAGTVTTTLSCQSSVPLWTSSRNGYVSPGLTQPVEETKEFSIPRVGAAARRMTGAVPPPLHAPDVCGERFVPTYGVVSVYAAVARMPRLSP